MNEKEKEYFRQLLQKKKRDLLSVLGYLNSTHDNAAEALSRSVNTDDHVLDTMEREMAFNLAYREKTYLKRLNEALDRIKEGTFGECRTCGGEIGNARLEAVPHATQCISCKSKDEKKRRGL